MTLNIFAPGVNRSFSSELNSNFNSFKVIEVYSGTGLNVNRVGGGYAGTDTESIELTAVASSTIYGANYVTVNISGVFDSSMPSGDSGYANVKIEIKEIGGSYSTLFYKTVYEVNDESDFKSYRNVQYTHELTAGEKSNGFQIQISVSGTSSANVSYEGNQVVERLEV